MAIEQSFVKLFIRLMNEYNIQGNLLTLGVQDVVATHEEMGDVLRECKYDIDDVKPEYRKYASSVRANQARFIFGKQWMHQEDLFLKMFKFSSLQSLDVFDSEHPDIIHDLNNPIPECFYNKFDVIIDIGVLEHVFDIRQAVENIVSMLKKDGVLIHSTPLADYDENKCFYYLQPAFYWDVYSANGFGDMKTYIEWMPKYRFGQSNVKCIYREYKYNDNVRFSKPLHIASTIFVARKNNEVENFAVPIQNYYQALHSRANSLNEIPEVPQVIMNLFIKFPVAKPIVVFFWKMLPVSFCGLLFGLFHRQENREEISL